MLALMKMVIDRQEFLEALGNVSRAVSAKATNPALEGILLKVQQNRLCMSAYDLEIGMQTVIDAKADSEKSIILNAKLLLEIIRKLPDNVVILECDDKLMVSIKSGDADFSLIAMDGSEYPEMPSIKDGASIIIEQQLLKGMIRQTIYAVESGLNSSRPVYTGSLFEFTEDTIRIVSVDGCRLAMRVESVKCNESMSFIVPGKTLHEVIKLIRDEEKQMSIAIGSRHIIFEIDEYAVISRLIEGEFLDYNAAIPVSQTTVVTAKTRDLIDATDRVSLMINDKLKSPVKYIFEENLLKISCNTTVGKAYDQIECKQEGEKVEIGFNNKLLIDAFRAAECDEVRLELNGSLSPVKILPLEGEDFLFLVLPVRLKNDM